MTAFLDANVLIWYLRGLPAASALLSRLSEQNVEMWMGAMQKVEILFFMRPGEERATRALLDSCRTAVIDDKVIDLATALFRQWNPSHGTDDADALLAASVILGNGTLYTLNTRHFPMPGLDVVRPW